MRKHVIFGIGLTLCACVLLPQLPAAVSGCNNGYLLGNYNAQVSNMNLQNVLQSLNGTGTTVTPAGTPPAATVVGFGSNPRSLSGSLPGTSRFYFDGAGGVVGLSAPVNGVSMAQGVGTYTVNVDCSATISLTGGATFDAVVADSGRQVIFLETDSSGSGSVGTLQRASSCVSLNYPQSFAFSFAGAAPPVASTGTGGTGGTTTTAAAFMPYSVIGTLSTDGNGSFSITETSISNGAVARSKAGGSYTVGPDCSLKLNFSANFPGTTSNFKAPATFSGLTSDSTGGVFLLQPDANAMPLTGSFIVQ